MKKVKNNCAQVGRWSFQLRLVLTICRDSAACSQSTRETGTCQKTFCFALVLVFSSSTSTFTRIVCPAWSWSAGGTGLCKNIPFFFKSLNRVVPGGASDQLDPWAWSRSAGDRNMITVFQQLALNQLGPAIRQTCFEFRTDWERDNLGDQLMIEGPHFGDQFKIHLWYRLTPPALLKND